MPVPAEYERASAKFYDLLLDARNDADLWSTHVTYTMLQSVLQVFRRRLTIQQAIDFANLLPIGLRALFVTDWDTTEETQPFKGRDALVEEIRSLREQHNFSVDNAIEVIARAIRKQVDEERFDAFLSRLPEGAVEFWSV